MNGWCAFFLYGLDMEILLFCFLCLLLSSSLSLSISKFSSTQISILFFLHCLPQKPRLARFAQATSVLFSLPFLAFHNHHNSTQLPPSSKLFLILFSPFPFFIPPYKISINTAHLYTLLNLKLLSFPQRFL